MNDFFANAKLLFEEGIAGKCPVCGSAHLIGVEHVNGKRYCASFSCPDCGKSVQFNGSIEPSDPKWHKNK